MILPKVMSELLGSKVIFLLLLTILFFGLELYYILIIVEEYGHLGFSFQSNYFKIIVGHLFFFAVVCFIPLIKNDSIRIVLLFFLILSFIPNLILFQFSHASLIPVFGSTVFIISTYFFHISFNTLKISFQSIPNYDVKYLFVGTLLLLIPYFLTFGFPESLSELSFETIYDYREKMAEKTNSYINYSYSTISKWLLPLMIAFGLHRKSFIWTFLGVICIIYLFVVTGNKITLFILPVAFFFALPLNLDNKISIVLIGLVILTFVSLYIIKPTNFLADNFIRRMLFLPALLNQQYIEFFTEPIYFSHSFLSKLIEYPYDLPPPKLIGLHYYKSVDINATNGIISDGFINLGITGVFLFTFFAGALTALTCKMNIQSVYLGVYFLLIHSFIDHAFFTSFLTHGLIFLFLIILFFIKETNSDAGLTKS
jgi:hypothetical protein